MKASYVAVGRKGKLCAIVVDQVPVTQDDFIIIFTIMLSSHACGREGEGEYEGGVLNGVGRLKNADGSIYEGNFVNGRRHGQGQCHKLLQPDFLGCCRTVPDNAKPNAVLLSVLRADRVGRWRNVHG